MTLVFLLFLVSLFLLSIFFLPSMGDAKQTMMGYQTSKKKTIKNEKEAKQ